MPTAPRKPCPRPGCPNTTAGGPCAEHRREYDRRRGPERQFYSTPRWRSFRRRILDEHPLCEECDAQGRTALATEVAHVVPRKEEPERTFDPGNVRALCKPCHSRETAERGERWPRG